jgi:TolB-like protein/Tfp pilus assembly protein PilF
MRALEERLRRAPGSPSAPTPPTASVVAPPPTPPPPTPPPPPHATSPTTPPAPSTAAPTRRRLRWRGALPPLLLVLTVAIVWAALPGRPAPGRSIVVLPFVNLSPNPDDAFFADGLTEEVISRLAAVPGLTVISRTSAMHYQGTRQPLGEIARELHVAQVLEGSVRRADGRVRVTVQLIDAASDAHRWAESFEYDRRESLRVQEDVAQAVARALDLDVGEQASRQLARRGTASPEANELYQRGRALWQTRTTEGHRQAIRLYEQAIALDSGYADAYAGIADAYLTAWQHNLLGMSEAESFARMRWAAERALALDDESAAAHTSFGIVLWWQKNWPGAMRELRRSLELNPGQAMTHGWYGLLLRATGHAEEAVREVVRSTELDPYSSPVRSTVGWQCYADRDYACTVEHYRRALALSPYAQAYLGVALGESQLGHRQRALDAIGRAIAISPPRPDLVADLAYFQARSGRLDEARASLRRAEANSSVEAFNVARAFVALGEPDSAFAWFGRASWQWPHRALLDDPALDPVRRDPRFARLRAQVMRDMGVAGDTATVVPR